MQQSNAVTGLVVAGRLIGLRKDERKGNDGQPWIRHFLGVETPTHNGFPGQTNVDEVQVPDSLLNAELYDKLQKFDGKDVFVAVYLRVYATKNGAGSQFNLSSQPDALRLQSSVAAVGKVA